MPSDSTIVKELVEETQNLKNISQIRKKLTREKILIDTELQAGIQKETKQLTSNINLLRQLNQRVANAKKNLGDMDNLYFESVKHVPEFDDTLSVATMLQNFDLTQKFVLHFKTFNAQLSEVKQLMDMDGDFDIDKKMPNLIPVHFKLNQLREVREEAGRYLRKEGATSDTRLTLKKLYEPLDILIDHFDQNLMMIGEDILETLRVGNSSLVVRTAKIIEFEERQDVVSKLVSEDKSEPKHYLERFFKSIENSIKTQFDNCMSTFPPDTNVEELLSNLGFVHSELQGAKEDLVPCCPERWEIFNKFVIWYHQGVHRTLETIMRFDPAPDLKLEILEYVKQYYKTMADVFGVSRKKTPELLTPPLLDGNERDLYDEYLEHLVSKLRQWYGNIWTTQVKEFQEGAYQPVQYEDRPGLDSHINVTKLISQQLDVAGKSQQARVIAGCVDACCDVIQERQQQCIELMRSATDKSIMEDPDAPNGTYEYLFLIANDQDRAYAFLDGLSAKWSAPMPPRYQGKVVQRFTQAQEGYQEVTKECFLQSLRFIYSDTKSAFDDVFSGDKWYSGVTMMEIIDTYDDYVVDTKRLLLKDLFDIFLGKLCTETILWYLRSMLVPSGAKPKKINMPRGRERIMEDAKKLYEFFTREEFGLDIEATSQAFYIFDILCDVLKAPFEQLPELFRELRSNERNAPVDLFEAMVSLRMDVDQRTLRDIMAKVKAEIVFKEPTQNTTGEADEDLVPSFLYEFKK